MVAVEPAAALCVEHRVAFSSPFEEGQHRCLSLHCAHSPTPSRCIQLTIRTEGQHRCLAVRPQSHTMIMHFG